MWPQARNRGSGGGSIRAECLERFSLWRIRSVVFGAAAAILWMTLLRFQPGYFWVTPLTPWALIVATITATLFLESVGRP